MNTAVDFNGLTLGGDNPVEETKKQIDPESGYEVGSSEHRNYYREKKDNERRAKDMEAMQGSIVNQVVQQLAPLFQGQNQTSQSSGQPVKTFDDYVQPNEDFSALDPALRGAASYAVDQSTAYASQAVGKVNNQVDELKQSQQKMGSQFAMMNAMFMVEDQNTVRSREFQNFLEKDTIMGYSTKDMIENQAAYGNQEAVVHGLNEAVTRFKSMNGSSLPSVSQMSNPAGESNRTHIPDSNKPMLDETWESKLENAKSNFRNDSNLSYEQKNSLELKYEAVQSKLRQLGGLRGNPQAYRQAQEEVTSLAIGFGVVSLPK